MTLMKLRLHFLFRDLSQHFGIYLVAFDHIFFIRGHGLNLFKVICDVKSKVICSHNGYGNYIMKPKKWNCKELGSWSDYKHHNTVKFLICVFPNSTITLAE